MTQGFLILESGEIFEGRGCNLDTPRAAEVVFTTGMCGYYESLTDPSFSDQFLVFTFPLIGNYGVAPKEMWESEKIHAAGAIINEECLKWSHYQGISSLRDWLSSQNIPLLSGVDTRQLAKTLRKKGTMVGSLTSDKANLTALKDPNETHLVKNVSIKEKKLYGNGSKRVIVVDCGMKESIIRQLMRFPLEIVRVPFDYDYSDEEFDGVFLSNGPGDPEKCVETLAVLKKVLRRQKPIFGICLGSQLLALTAGAKTYKLRFGHRGQNQPCMDLETGRCYITSQNHGYAIDESSLPQDWKVIFKNLNDGSVEGIAHRELPFRALQFHPEAAPGPTDTRWFFERFYSCLV